MNEVASGTLATVKGFSTLLAWIYSYVPFVAPDILLVNSTVAIWVPVPVAGCNLVFLKLSPTMETFFLTLNGNCSLKVPFLSLIISPATLLTLKVKA